MQRNSAVARILLSLPLSGLAQARALDVAHRTLMHQMDIHDLVRAIEETVGLCKRLYRRKLVRSFAAFRQLPSQPSVYLELTQSLNDDHIGFQEIASVVERDAALSARILQLVNSASFGLGRHVCSLREALSWMGLGTLRGLALAGHLKATYAESGDWEVFSFEQLSLRSLAVGRLARDIAADFVTGRALGDQIFLSGLMIDIGMLMLAAEQSEGYEKVIRYAGRNRQPLHEVEKMAFGVDHAELGAYMLSTWNIAPQVVENVMTHPAPLGCLHHEFTPAAAVHIADALIPPLENSYGVPLNSSLDMQLLERMEVIDRLPHWKEMAENCWSSSTSGGMRMA